MAYVRETTAGTPTKASAVPTPPVYTIGSEKGYNIVNMLQPGQSTNDLDAAYRPGDQSVWTKNPNGSISVVHNGQTMTGKLTYSPQTQTPTNSQPAQTPPRTSNNAVMPEGWSGGSQSNQTPTANGTYTIGSPAGYELASGLVPGGGSVTASDKSVWWKDAAGNLWVNQNGVTKQGVVTYQPPEAVQPQKQETPVTPITPGQSQLVYPSQNPNRLTEADIKAMYETMQQQQQNKIDFTVQQAVEELNRAQEDAQKGFDSQRDKVNIDEAQARDAQVLYAAARGDRGGITARQYDSISNTAANNRHAIAEAQQKLATDTARQIADLRAQGEFEKADALLQIAQQQLAQLFELQQYEDNLLMNEQQLAMQESSITGSYGGKPTVDVQIADRQWEQALKEWDYTVNQNEREWAYQTAMQSIQAGIVPDAGTLSAAGISQNMASQLASVYKTAMTAKGSSSGSGGGGTTTKTMSLTTAQNMAEAGQFTDEVLQAFYKAGYNDAYLYEMYGYEPGGSPPDEEDYMIANSHGESWVVVPGYSRVSYQELERLVNSGEVLEIIDHEKQTVTYRKKR